MWTELQSISDLKFTFHEESDPLDYVTGLAAAQQLVEARHVLVAEWLHDSWQPQLVASLLDHMHPTASDYRCGALSDSRTRVHACVCMHVCLRA